jgi:hypothetical protein
LLIGYLFGVRSDRQLVREIEVNVAYRWFLGLKLTDPVFDASTLSQNRRRRYNAVRRRPSSRRAMPRRSSEIEATLMNTRSLSMASS